MMPPVHRLLIGRTVAALATALIPTTLILAVLRTGTPTDLGIVLACELVPMLMLLPVAGVAADRFRAGRVVLAADLVRAAAQFGIGAELLAGSGRIPLLAGLAAVTGAAIAFGMPAVRTLVAGCVAEPDRLRTNARLNVAQGLAQITGPAAAGGLMLAIGPGWSSMLTGLLFMGSAATLGSLQPRRRATSEAGPTEVRGAKGSRKAMDGTAAAGAADAAESADVAGTAGTAEPADTADNGADTAKRRHWRADLRDGWAEARRHPWFLTNVAGHGVWHLAAGFLLTLGPAIAVDHLGGETAWVVIAQLGAVGMVAGAFAAARLPIRRPAVAVAVGASAYAIPLVAFAVHAPVAVVTAAYFAAMFGLGVLSPLWETMMQNRIPAEALGRVGSFDALISFAARPVGLAVAAPVAAVIGTSAPLLIAAALVAAANLAILLLPDALTAPIGTAEEYPSTDTAEATEATEAIDEPHAADANDAAEADGGLGSVTPPQAASR
ncbi:MFS transporter [Yinghuangia soli]|uniref:MFS transporter n=1 Tax=Yinghuangia soli TaxID=2908204 RepID=A0AA41U6Q8_9ACTN|nr:MFS transporter [Yinghuangia soli]MCF2533267.1 MFS transporter [Yinghuangia soli]